MCHGGFLLKTDPVTGWQCEYTCNTALLDLITEGGTTRGIPNQAVTVTPITAAVSSLLPSQNEIDAQKALQDPLQDPDLLKDYLAGGTVLAKSVILTAADGLYIVDGHHRWGGLYVINPYSQLSSIDLGYVPDAQEALKETQVAIVAEQGYLNAETVSGDNLYTISEDEFQRPGERDDRQRSGLRRDQEDLQEGERPPVDGGDPELPVGQRASDAAVQPADSWRDQSRLHAAAAQR
jgi:hypothetical protein